MFYAVFRLFISLGLIRDRYNFILTNPNVSPCRRIIRMGDLGTDGHVAGIVANGRKKIHRIAPGIGCTSTI